MGRKENLANARNIFSEIMNKISSHKEEYIMNITKNTAYNYNMRCFLYDSIT